MTAEILSADRFRVLLAEGGEESRGRFRPEPARLMDRLHASSKRPSSARATAVKTRTAPAVGSSRGSAFEGREGGPEAALAEQDIAEGGVGFGFVGPRGEGRPELELRPGEVPFPRHQRAEAEAGEGLVGVERDRVPVERLGFFRPAPLVEDGAEPRQRPGVAGTNPRQLAVALLRLGEAARIAGRAGRVRADAGTRCPARSCGNGSDPRFREGRCPSCRPPAAGPPAPAPGPRRRSTPGRAPSGPPRRPVPPQAPARAAGSPPAVRRRGAGASRGGRAPARSRA